MGRGFILSTTENMPTENNGLATHEVTRRLTFDGDQAIIRRQQEIPDDFWDQVARLKHINETAPVGEYMHVAAIPDVIVEKWYAEGFNIFDPNVDHKQILARLRNEDMDRLITTSRKV